MKKGQHVGYVRVSSYDQNLARQLEGVALDKTFTEKASAKDAKRPVLEECVSYLREGDTLHVHSIDRLARNLADLQRLIELFGQKGVTVCFAKEGLTFSTEVSAMSKLMLQVMGAFAEFERSLIKERQREGIAAAQKAGKLCGRSPKLSPEQVAELRARITRGESKKALAAEYGVSRQTLYAALGAS